MAVSCFIWGGDGNLVLYDAKNNPTLTALWSTGTFGNANAFAVLQADGNLVVFNSTGTTALWNSGSHGTGLYTLAVQDDGNLVMYQKVWDTNTSQTAVTGTFTPSCSSSQIIGEILNWVPGQSLWQGQCAVSVNGRFELFMQLDGNLVLYDLSTTPATALWSSGT